MGYIETGNRSSSSMGSLVTSVLIKTDGSTLGEQATQLANYWRQHFQIPEMHPDGNWYQYPQGSNSVNQAGESQESLPGSDMEDTDSLIVYAASALAPSQIHQPATILWNILNNDRGANLAILEKLENPANDPIQAFSAADLAHLASH